mmetsp:Transcript_41614/g.81564  ORF Transcript_41614/g.81564 Transcript_41614/m.81564 type:complete len:92 (+) Transcript_41614:125-400(+)
MQALLLYHCLPPSSSSPSKILLLGDNFDDTLTIVHQELYRIELPDHLIALQLTQGYIGPKSKGKHIVREVGQSEIPQIQGGVLQLVAAKKR